MVFIPIPAMLERCFHSLLPLGPLKPIRFCLRIELVLDPRDSSWSSFRKGNEGRWTCLRLLNNFIRHCCYVFAVTCICCFWTQQESLGFNDDKEQKDHAR